MESTSYDMKTGVHVGNALWRC